jgi:hypothetical protein
MRASSQYSRILAIDPSTRGFGFVVVEGRMRLVDWGAARVWSDNGKEFVARIECLIQRYGPVTIVLEDRSGSGSTRARNKVRLLIEYLSQARVRLLSIPRPTVHAAFRDTGPTKHQIAVQVAQVFPELEPHLPPKRKPWMSQDERMSFFYAAALVIASVTPV